LVRRYVLSQFLSRYGAVVKGLETARDIARERLLSLQQERAILLGEKEKMPLFISESRPTLEIPSGLEGIFVVGLILIVMAFVGFEWINAAAFAARAETHSLPLALSLSSLFAVAPLALKCWVPHLSASVARFANITIALVGVVSGIAFVALYAASYAGQETSATNVVEAITNPGASPPVSGDKRLLLIFQILAGTAVGVVFAMAIAKRITLQQRVRLNKDRSVFDKRLAELDRLVDEWRQKLSQAEGGLEEWQHSIEVELAPCLAYLTAVQECQRKQDNLRRLAENEANEAARDLATLTFPTNSKTNNRI